MKIVFVRGPHLNPWETQTYRAVAARHEFVTVAADWGFHGGGPSGLPGARDVYPVNWNSVL